MNVPLGLPKQHGDARPDAHAGATPVTRPRRWVTAWPIVLILLLAALMRMNHVNQPLTDAFSWRQSSTAMMAENFFRRSWNIFYPEVNWNGPGPSYQGREFQTVSYLTALLYVIVGQHEVVGRLVAITFGVWGVFALYRLTRRAWDEERSLASAAVIAVLPGAVFIDRSFLPDPAMVALATTTLWTLVTYLQTSKPRYLVLTALIGIWALASKLPGLLIVVPGMYAVFAVLGPRRALRPRQLMLFGLLAVVVFVPVALYYLWARELARTYPPYHFAGSGNWVWVEGPWTWLERRYYLRPFSAIVLNWLWTPSIVGLVVIGLLFSPNQRPTPDSTERRCRVPWLFHFWLVGCAGYYLIGARELTENPWNLHIFNPPAAALGGQALFLIASIGSRSIRSRAASARAVVIVSILIIASQRALATMYNSSARDGYELGLALQEHSAPGDLVVTVTSDTGDPVAIYYSRRRGWTFPPPHPDREWGLLPTDDGESIQLFEELRASGAGWLGVVRRLRNNESWEQHELLLEHIRETCEFVAEGSGWVVYRIRSPGELTSSPGP